MVLGIAKFCLRLLRKFLRDTGKLLRRAKRRASKHLEKASKKFGRANRKARDRLRQSRAYVPLKNFAARLRRVTLRNTTFVSVTGSCGKTTTTSLIDAILSQEGQTHTGLEFNLPLHVTETVYRMPRAARFCVQEVSGGTPGHIVTSARMLRPDIGIVLNIASDHYKQFRTLEATALEKGKLLEKLPKAGIAILNADDPHVRSMEQRTPARILTFGMSPNANVRATEVSGSWPERLCLTVVCGDRAATVHTQLVGDFWASSVLAAIACGIACGLDLDTCAKGVSEAAPLFGRYSAHERSDGAVYILDTHKAPFWTLSSGFAFVSNAQATRKTVVIGNVSDYPGAGSKRYRRVAREALEVADRVVFVGSSAGYVSRLRRDGLRDRLFNFETVYQASSFLSENRVPGELIYLKTSRAQHLDRIMLSAIDNVVCWKEKCGRPWNCDECSDYSKPAAPPFGLAPHLDH